ncbi:unnamed protein product [Caenorhabditis nigoni]
MAREEQKDDCKKVKRAKRKRFIHEKRTEIARHELMAQLSDCKEKDDIEVVKANGYQLVVKGKVPFSRYGLADWWFNRIGTAASYVAFSMNRKTGGYEQKNFFTTYVDSIVPGEEVTFKAIAFQHQTTSPQLLFEATAIRNETEVTIAKGSSTMHVSNPQPNQ